jgi:gliding motility-associated-like protein
LIVILQINLSRMKKYVFILLFFIVFYDVKAQQLSNEGVDFWMGFMENPESGSSTDLFLNLFITSRKNTTGTVSVPLQNWNVNFAVNANTSTTVSIPASIAHTLGIGFNSTGVHITSADSISVFAINNRLNSTDATVVLPTKALGVKPSYIVAAFQETISADINNGVDYESEALIVGVEDDTPIEIEHTSGLKETITLQQGQTYQLKSTGDVSGSMIKGLDSCKTFAVFAGVECVNVPSIDCIRCDHIVSQQYPTFTWDKTYLSTPFGIGIDGNNNSLMQSGGYLLRVFREDMTTEATIDDNAIVWDKAGGRFAEIAIDDYAAHIIQADKPISVAQYMKGQACNGLPQIPNLLDPFAKGDPSLLILNPTTQTVNQATFSLVSTSNLSDHFVNIIVATNQKQNVKLRGGGTNIPINQANFKTFTNAPEYSWIPIYLNYTQAGSLITSYTLECPAGFVAYCYGVGERESYAYTVGATFDNLRFQYELQDKYSISMSGDFKSCVGVPIDFRGIGENALAWTWDFGDGSPLLLGKNVQHIYSQSGFYDAKLIVTIQDGCGTRDIIVPRKIEVLPFPNLVLPDGLLTCIGNTIKLNAGDWGSNAKYEWSNGHNERILEVIEPEEYSVTVTNEVGCQFTSNKIWVGQAPLPDVNFTNLKSYYCINNPALTLSDYVDKTGGSFTLDGITTTTLNPQTLGLGEHLLKYTYQSPDNLCIKEIETIVKIEPLPVLSFVNLKTTYCFNDPETVLDDFVHPQGGQFSINGQNISILKPSAVGEGEHTLVYTFTDALGCTNQISTLIKIFPFTALSFTNLKPDFCEDEPAFDLTATPLGGIFTIDNQPNAILDAANLSIGKHTITYTYTDANACVYMLSQEINIRPLPIVNILNVQSAYCSNDAIIYPTASPEGGTFLLDNQSITQINPAQESIGEHTLVYIFSDEYSCTQTDTVKFIIHLIPEVHILGLNTQKPYCIDSPPFELIGSPQGGTFQVNGQTETMLKPANLGVGEHTIVYTYTHPTTLCTNTDMQKVQVSNLPALDFITVGGLEAEYCMYPDFEPLELAKLATPQGGKFWIDGIAKTFFDPIDLGAGTHFIVYEYQDANDCINTLSKLVVIYALPQVEIKDISADYCIDAPPFELASKATPLGGTFTVNGVVKATFHPQELGEGNYEVIYQYTHPQTQCENQDKTNVVVHALPQNLIEPTSEEWKICSNSGRVLTLNAGYQGIDFLWKGENYQRSTRTAEITKSGTYQVTIKDFFGCEATYEVNVMEDCHPEFVIPNAFSPNYDGVNDTFEIFGQDFNQFEIKILNRWGEIVFISNQRNITWDGTHRGRIVPEGVYVAVVKYKELPQGPTKEFKTKITLIR